MRTKESSMSTMSASPAERRGVLVWDAPVRVFHWLLAVCFAGAWLTAESESWRLVHVTLGYTMAGLVAFRLAWGFLGPAHARFSDFVRGPSAVVRYLRSLVSGRPEHHVGHNPLGGVAVLLMLALTVLVALTGYANYHEWGGDLMEELHEATANAMLAVVLVHVAGVLFSSVVHRENLVRGMVDGRKPGTATDAIGRARKGVAAVLALAVVGFWYVQWTEAPAYRASAHAVQARGAHHDD
jgi:cytochrome b